VAEEGRCRGGYVGGVRGGKEDVREGGVLNFEGMAWLCQPSKGASLSPRGRFPQCVRWRGGGEFLVLGAERGERGSVGGV